jgi:hypothetical protein
MTREMLAAIGQLAAVLVCIPSLIYLAIDPLLASPHGDRRLEALGEKMFLPANFKRSTAAKL